MTGLPSTQLVTLAERAKGLGSGQAVLLQLAVHRSLSDPEDPGCLLAVAADLLEGGFDENLLHLLERHAQQGMNIDRRSLFTLVNILRQIAYREDGPLGYDYHILYHVLEFPNVSRPGIGTEDVDRLSFDLAYRLFMRLGELADEMVQQQLSLIHI